MTELLIGETVIRPRTEVLAEAGYTHQIVWLTESFSSDPESRDDAENDELESLALPYEVLLRVANENPAPDQWLYGDEDCPF